MCRLTTFCFWADYPCLNPEAAILNNGARFWIWQTKSFALRRYNLEYNQTLSHMESMTNLEKLKLAFSEGLGMEIASVTEDLEYGNMGWESVGHMALVAAIERAFDVMLETSDVIGLSSFAKAKEILSKYGT